MAVLTPAPVGTPGAAVFSAATVATPTVLTPTTGSGYAVGDLLLCLTACRSATPTVSTPAGWVSLLNVTGTNGRIALFGRHAASTSEAAPSVVWNGLTVGTSGTPCGARIQAFSGVSGTDVIGTVEDGAASTTTSASGTALTTVNPDDFLLALSTRLDDAGTWSAPSGMTMVNANGSTSGLDFAFAWAYQVKSSAGSSAPADFGLASASSFASSGVLIALKAVVTADAPPLDETIIDDFNRADGLVSAGAGAALWNADAQTARIVSNQIARNGVSGANAYSLFSFQASDYDFVFDIPVIQLSLSFDIYFGLQGIPPSVTPGYLVTLALNSLTVERRGTPNTTLIGATPAILPGTTAIWISMRGATISVYYRRGSTWHFQASGIDSSPYSGGRIRIGPTTDTERFDNIRGGPLAGAVPSAFAKRPLIKRQAVNRAAVM